MILGHPVPETVNDIADYSGMVAVEGVSASAEIAVFSSRSEHVIDAVVHTLKGHEGTCAVPLCSVIEHNIQINFYLVVLQDLNQILELRSFLVIFDRCRICCIGGKKSHRVVSPVFQKPFSVVSAGIDRLVKFKDGHEFDRSDPQALQMGNLFYDPGECARILHP